VKKARLVKREVESMESAPKTDGEAKESAVKTDGELKQSAPKTEGELKQSAPKTEGELFTLLLSYWDNRLFSLLSALFFLSVFYSVFSLAYRYV
jgi:hypothetical protein